MLPGPDQWRLLWAAILVALPVIAGYRFARKLQPQSGAIADAILIGYLVQYVSVGLAGLLGILTPAWLTIIGMLCCAVLWISAGIMSADERAPVAQARSVLGIGLGALGFLAALIYFQRTNPPLATDALTYHLPAAVLWLQKKRIVLFQTWFFNPANTFSPLSGSMFITWLLAPMGDDSLARFVQVGPWMLIFFSVMNLARSGGAGFAAAALAGLAVVLSRPFISESILAKDDLFVAAFFLSAVAAIGRDRMCSRFRAGRIGISVGLLLATKYTAVLSLPILLLGLDAPWRARWRLRQWVVAIGSTAILAGPWYLRNLIVWGNPVFPVKVDFAGIHLAGLFSPLHARELRTLNGFWDIVTGGYYGLPASVFIFLAVIWLITLVKSGRSLLDDSLRRVMVLGPPLGLALFAFLSPQAEVRFLLPTFGLMFALCPLAAKGKWSVGFCAIAAVFAIATSFSSANADQIVRFALWGIVVGMIGLLIRWLEADMMRLRRPVLSFIACAIAACVIFVRWDGYLNEYRKARLASWKAVYPSQAAMWEFVEKNVSPQATIAYSNQFMIYPLYGFGENRRVVYAPVREDTWISNLVFPAGIADTDLNRAASNAANSPADLAAWKRNLRETGAEYLTVGRADDAPEIAWADGDPAHFRKIFAGADFTVYRIRGLH